MSALQWLYALVKEVQSLVRAIWQCNGLERLVAVEQTPETFDTRPPLFLPGDVHVFKVEILDSLGVGRTYEVV